MFYLIGQVRSIQLYTLIERLGRSLKLPHLFALQSTFPLCERTIYVVMELTWGRRVRIATTLRSGGTRTEDGIDQSFRIIRVQTLREKRIWCSLHPHRFLIPRQYGKDDDHKSH